MQPPVLAAIITSITAALVALTTAVLGYWTKRATDERLKSLEKQQREDDARLSYEYEARKRVYSELGPLLFALVETCEEAHWRIGGIARSAREGKLWVGRDNRLRSGSEYMVSTIYRLVAPLAVLRLVQQRMTLVDLSVEPTIQRIYILAKMLRRSWSDGRDFARQLDLRDYDRRGSESDPTTARQHISLQDVDALVDLLVSDPAPGKASEVIRYSMFIGRYQVEGANPLRDACKPFEKVLKEFHPARQPILWLLLATQDMLCSMIAQYAAGAAQSVGGKDSNQLPFDQMIVRTLNWRSPSETNSGHPNPLEVQEFARGYIQDRLQNTLQVSRAS